jgi:hypothetical protein
MRYLFPWPVPQRWRRRMIALGSGDASCIICSSLIAQAFDVVRCPAPAKVSASTSAIRQELSFTWDDRKNSSADANAGAMYQSDRTSLCVAARRLLATAFMRVCRRT